MSTTEPHKGTAVGQPEPYVAADSGTDGGVPARDLQWWIGMHLGAAVHTNGTLMARGKVARAIGQGIASAGPRVAELNAIPAIRAVVGGDLSLVSRVAREAVFVAASDPSFSRQTQVAHRASELLGGALVECAGQPARPAVGVAVLPLDAPAEATTTVQV